jgi:beta-phosphoglucomutase
LKLKRNKIQITQGVKVNLKNIKAFLFDMDGTVVDSIPYHYIAWYEFLRPFGIKMTPQYIFEVEGKDSLIILQNLFKKAGIPLTQDKTAKLLSQKRKIFLKHFQPHLFADAVEIIKFLKEKGFAVGLVTGSGIVIVKEVLPKQVMGYFDAIVTVDMTKRGKPYPDPYLTAAKTLKYDPKNCLVIENAPFGIRAAKSAAMICFAVETTLSRDRLKEAGADKTFKTHKDLLDFLKDAQKRS